MILFSSLLADGAHTPGHTRHNSDSEWLWGVVCAAEGGVRHAVVSALCNELLSIFSSRYHETPRAYTTELSLDRKSVV